MAGFSEVMKQWKRMCQYYTAREDNDHDACAICKFEGDGSNCLAVYEDEEVDTAEVERVVMAWAAEHPEPVYPTWYEWLNHIGVLGTAAIGAGYVGERLCTMHIPADIAEKLGLEPKKQKEG